MFVFPMKITPICLFVGLLGAYLGNIGMMEKTKYRMMCAPPNNTLLKGERISKTHDHQYWLESMDAEQRIIASLAVFKKRRTPVLPHCYLEDFTINLLPAYNQNDLVPAEQTSKILNGALVEVHLSLSHNHIRKQGESFDSFNGNIHHREAHLALQKEKSTQWSPLPPFHNDLPHHKRESCSARIQ
ncbi:hypothetical protein JB92DRAFT_2828580 [Gautieria morchelliformis]|nr:hypothetical protein JB92DRAFT_2828580 [Gautieria morchelliformis]